MKLTKEVIDRICDSVKNDKIFDAVRELRYASPLGLRQGRDFVEKYRSNVEGLREALMDMANLKAGTVFENSFMRIELKAGDASFQEVHPFLIKVLQSLYPNLSSKELQNFCQNVISFRGRPSVEELQELSMSLFDRFYPELKDEDDQVPAQS